MGRFPWALNPMTKRTKTMNINEKSKHLIDQWLKYLSTRNVEGIVELYYTDGILVPTLGQSICQGEEEIKQYFENFIGDHPNLCGNVTLELCQEIRDHGISVSGKYTFTWGEEKKEKLDARFTYVFTRDVCEEKWKILTHHSSAIPDKPETKSIWNLLRLFPTKEKT